LNKNRNPHLSKEEIEEYLKNYYGQEQVLWVSDGIIGDDTDGHIDDTVRFVNENTVLTVVEDNPEDENYEILQTNPENCKK
jgi:agmatine deiminase